MSAATATLESAGLRGVILIDCSHGNSQKDYRRQPAVAEAVAAQVADGSRAIVGVMVESNLVEGRQNLGSGELVRGQSITDACVSWADTVPMLEGARRGGAGPPRLIATRRRQVVGRT